MSMSIAVTPATPAIPAAASTASTVPISPPPAAPPNASGPRFTRTLDDVRDLISTADQDTWDAVVPCRRLLLHQGRLVFPQAQTDGYAEGLNLSPWAFGQACQKLGLPAQYLKKCPPRLQDENVNHWLRQDEIGRRLGQGDDERDAAWLVRARGGTARGVLSPRYTKLDNAELLDALLPVLGCTSGRSDTRYKVGLCQLSSESFHLRLVDPGIGRDVLPGDRLMVGVHLANSEVGFRSVTVDALVFRLVCTNGLIRRVNHRSLLRQRHIHVSGPKFREALASALSEAVVVAAGFIEQLALATRTPVPDPARAMDTLAGAWGLTQTTREFVNLALLGEPGGQQHTLYGLVNALTNAAQRLPTADDRYDLETLAGVLLDGTAAPSPAAAALRRSVLEPAAGSASPATDAASTGATPRQLALAA